MNQIRTHESVGTLVIGGGQAGLSVGYHLARRHVPFVILDRNKRIGDVWRKRWDSLRLFTPARYDGLPGMRFPAPAHEFPTKEQMADYLEAYAGIGYAPKDGISIKGKFFYSPDFGGKITDGNTPAEYLSGDLAVPLPSNFSILGYVGYSFGDYWDKLKDQGIGDKYFDWNLGVGYTAGKFSMALKWIDGSDLKESKDVPHDFFTSKARVVFTVATTFPWGE